MHSDCIFALATANTYSALHLHRLSGPNLFIILEPYLLNPATKKPIELKKIFAENDLSVTRYLLINNNHSAENILDIIDDVVIIFYKSPRSFTGEDVIEISTHGNPLICARLHSLLRKIGLRDAGPGEFTQRAVLNSKLDLVQAEAINQLIHAESMGALELARNNIAGILSEETINLRNNILQILAYLEAHIDFSFDEVGTYQPELLLAQLAKLQKQLTLLLNSYQTGCKIKTGLKIVLCGKPNSGKSSLYNALLKQQKAIVSNIPGTTRDVLEDRLLISGKDFVLLDTAGIRHTADIVELLGIKRSFASIENADIICYLIPLDTADIEIEVTDFLSQIEIKQSQKIIIVLTKKDLISKDSLPADKYIAISQFDYNVLINKLLEIYEDFYNKNLLHNQPILISQRQKDKVTKTLAYIQEASNLINIHDYPEKIASVLNFAKNSLSEIIGEIFIDDVMHEVFSTFCIGK